jgi:hypothetical protein
MITVVGAGDGTGTGTSTMVGLGAGTGLVTRTPLTVFVCHSADAGAAHSSAQNKTIFLIGTPPVP